MPNDGCTHPLETFANRCQEVPDILKHSTDHLLKNLLLLGIGLEMVEVGSLQNWKSTENLKGFC